LYGGILLLSDEFKRFWAGFEISVAIFLYFFTLWVIAPHAGESWANVSIVVIMIFASVYVIAVSPFIHKDTLADRGLGNWCSCFIRQDNLRKATVQFGVVTLAGAALLVMLSLWLDTEALSKINWLAVRDRFLFYLPFALVQNFFFYGFIFQRMLTIIPRPMQSEMLSGKLGDNEQDIVRHRLAIAVLMGIIFSACHFPNFSMMLICFAAGIFWTRIFYLTPNILMLVMSHALLGTILSRITCLYTRVGPFYANNDRYVFITVFSGIKELFTGLLKIAVQ
jgi:hypothetical protein